MEDKIILYSTNCPKCKVLQQKLDAKHIKYEKVTDVDQMQTLGILSVPVMEIHGYLQDFGTAVAWVNQQEEPNVN